MAFIQADIKCPNAGRTVTTRLYYPTDLPDTVGNEIKGVLTLLHGITNTGADWALYSAAYRYAADNGLVLVIPNADNSFYLNLAYGDPYFTMLTEEFPQQLHRIFRLPTQRECNYIAGLSMGGYGAMLIGLTCPQRYAAIGSFSGALDMAGMMAVVKQTPAMHPKFRALFGDNFDVPPGANLMELAKKVAALPQQQQPRIFTTCGLQDDDENGRILTQNYNFRDAVQGLPLDYTLRTWPGVHEWNFWDRSLADFIGFIQNSNYGQRKRNDWISEAT